ncbi:MAG TPA: hypothetical protein VFG83_11040 [Kofleriaceae bacterium]|nr:hypothetical protein [Kofleriaceae bacterium]
MVRLRPRAPKGAWTILVCAAFAGINLATIGSAAVAKPARRRPVHRNLNKCIDFSHRTDDHAMVMRFDNGCGHDLHCTVRWSLICQESGKRTEHAETFDLADGDSHEVEASAAACGDSGWGVDGGRWDCHDS